MTTICAWCDRLIATKPMPAECIPFRLRSPQTSHGICPECAAKFFPGINPEKVAARTVEEFAKSQEVES